MVDRLEVVEMQMKRSNDQDYYQMWVRTKRKTMSKGNGQKW